jgi:hypothetical protein
LLLKLVVQRSLIFLRAATKQLSIPPFNKLPWMRSSTFWLSSSSNSISDSIEESVLAPSSSSESSKTTAVSLMIGRGSSIKRKTNHYLTYVQVINWTKLKITLQNRINSQRKHVQDLKYIDFFLTCSSVPNRSPFAFIIFCLFSPVYLFISLKKKNCLFAYYRHFL